MKQFATISAKVKTPFPVDRSKKTIQAMFQSPTRASEQTPEDAGGSPYELPPLPLRFFGDLGRSFLRSHGRPAPV